MILRDDPLFHRAYSIKIGDIEINSQTTDRQGTASSLRCVFRVDRDKTPLANSAELRIFNLNKEHRDALTSEEEVTCEIQAGYEQTLGQIFFGTLRDIISPREGPDFIVVASASDSEDLLLDSRVSASFPAGTPLKDVLKALVKAVGLTEGNVEEVAGKEYGFLSGGTKLEVGTTFAGSAANELNWFCRSVGLEWSIQNGAWVGAIVGQASSPGGPLFSPATGLVGEPSVIKNSAKQIEKSKKRAAKEKGRILAPMEVSGRALLSADLFPGRGFRLECEKIEGDFVCTETKHMGDTHGQDWYVDFHGDPAPPMPPEVPL